MAVREPTISDFLDIARQGIVAEDKVADLNRGSDYESRTGPNSMLWSRQVQRDTDLWKSTRFNDAEGPDLTTLIEWRHGITRTVDTRGSGTAVIARPTATGGSGTVYKGTRIRMASESSEPVYYRVTSDTSVGDTDLNATLPIEAIDFGPGYKTSSAPVSFTLTDSLWDTTWYVSSLVCADGGTLESAPAYRARVRQARSEDIPGSEQAIIDACTAAGATNVALFPSTYPGLSADVGLNCVYVGDSGYSASTDLIRACTKALWNIKVCGTNLQVMPLVRTALTIVVDVYFVDAAAVMPIVRLDRVYRQAVQKYFGDNGRFTYTLSGIESAIAVIGTETQDVVVASPATDATILVGGNLPATLSRYYVPDNNLTIRYHGPNA